jgi:hypothetical protein
MYDLTYGQVFSGTPSPKIVPGRRAPTAAKKASRSKVAAVLVGLIFAATTTAGAVTIRHKASGITGAFTSQLSGSSGKIGGAAGFEDALY